MSVPQATGANVVCKLYRVDPTPGNRLPYEGLCLAPVLPDGRQVLILVSDSQAGYKGVLRDWFKTIVLK